MPMCPESVADVMVTALCPESVADEHDCEVRGRPRALIQPLSSAELCDSRSCGSLFHAATAHPQLRPHRLPLR